MQCWDVKEGFNFDRSCKVKFYDKPGLKSQKRELDKLSYFYALLFILVCIESNKFDGCGRLNVVWIRSNKCQALETAVFQSRYSGKLTQAMINPNLRVSLPYRCRL